MGCPHSIIVSRPETLGTEGNNMSGTDTANKSEAVSIAAYRRYCSQIDKEDELIDKRANWLLTSQSILFAAVGLSGNEMTGIVLSIVPWAGLFSSFAIGVTVRAASFSLRDYRNKLEEVCPPINDPKEYSPPEQDRCWRTERPARLVKGLTFQEPSRKHGEEGIDEDRPWGFT
jgi:hypothetical protein